MRVQARPRRRHQVHPLIAGLVAIPVVAGIYLREVDRRLAARRPAMLATAFVVVSLAASLAGYGRTAATLPTAYRPVDAQAFRSVMLSEHGTPGPAASAAGSPATSAGAVAGSAEVPTMPPGADVARAPASPAAAEAPSVVRFRPRPGQTGISRLAALSVRFTQPMDHASTRRAFRAAVGGTAVTGRYYWAEGDTVLVLVPDHALPFGATVTLAVGSGARSADGLALAGDARARFTTVPQPTPAPRPASAAAPAPSTRPSASGWRWPLIGPITQYFGQSLTKYGYHEGIDIDGQTGDPVRAARTGQVVVAGHYDSCGGLEVHIDHGNGLVSWYRHLSQILVHVGQRVTAGTVIGRVGETGCALGSHLHFAIRKGSTFVDPLRYLPRR